jgi:heme oxygenase
MADVLRMLRTGTASRHDDVERTLDLMDPGLRRSRLVSVLDRLHGFWAAAEAGLDGWAGRQPGDACAVDWPCRRRTALFADELRALGAPASAQRPDLAPVIGTDEALGRMYVLEGSTLGGRLIDRHLAGLPQLADRRGRRRQRRRRGRPGDLRRAGRLVPGGGDRYSSSNSGAVNRGVRPSSGVPPCAGSGASSSAARTIGSDSSTDGVREARA